MKVTEYIIALEQVELRTNSYWNFYTTVVLAVGAWLFLATTKLNIIQLGVIFISLIVFFTANLVSQFVALQRVQALETEIAAIAADVDIKTPELLRHLQHRHGSLRVWFTFTLHILIDMAVLYLVWLKLQ